MLNDKAVNIVVGLTEFLFNISQVKVSRPKFSSDQTFQTEIISE